MSAGQTRQKSTKKRSLRGVNEHFEAIFNAVWPSAIVNQKLPIKKPATCRGQSALEKKQLNANQLTSI
ncbi:hypothetical protein JI62_12655 [Halomonas campaniensis]|uniref:Uncharacterized protein n=1 Tax=Halomonas campaniensis TaxID=213554 RepID=A0A246RWJ5_9GAMM|nr:hypothetical protein JI62_12655 [Halomonas campaniensis]